MDDLAPASHGAMARTEAEVLSNKRTKRQKKRHRSLPKKTGLKLFEHPFNRVDHAALRAALIERGAAAGAQLPITLAKIVGHFRTHDAIVILSTLGFYGSLQGVTVDGPDGKTIVRNVEQHHLELLQALALTVPQAEAGHLPPPPRLIQEIIEDVGTLSDSFALSRLGAVRDGASGEEHVLISLQERLRLHTQVVRNWGYVHQVRLLSSELYSSIDAELEQAVGFTATDLIAVVSAMIRTYEVRASERFALLGDVMKMPTSEGMVRAYYASFPSLEQAADELLHAVRHLSRAEVGSMLLSHSELSLPELASFSSDELASGTGISANRVEIILQHLTLNIGDLFSSEPMYFFMDNPIWSRPGVRVDSTFVFPIPQVGLSHVNRIVRGVIEASGIKPTYELRRAKYLERKVGELLQRAFPMARVLPSVEWSIGPDRYETDRLVVLDRAILIVEAKSAALTVEALRGAPKRVKKHITDLVVDPARQSQRLEEVIRLSRSGDAACRRITDEIGIDVTSIDTIIRLSITLDDFSMIATAEEDLKAVGWAPQDLALPATLNLADFETIIDILERPAFILHYFAERARFQRAASLLADEIDLLGVYLHSLFNIPDLSEGKTGKTGLIASGESKPIDDYYNRLEAGMPATKPSVAVAPQVLFVLDRLAERMPPGWITISLDLLSIGNRHQQDALWKGLETLRREVPKTQQDPGHQCALIITPANSDAVVAMYVFTQARAHCRRETMEQLAGENLERTGRKRMTIIGKQVELWDEPYRIAAVAYAQKDLAPAEQDDGEVGNAS